MDRSGHCVAIAGRYGLAHCTIFAKRWKLFGNVTQEKDMSVSGGITWWKDFIVMSCYNHYENRHEVRVTEYTVLGIGIRIKPKLMSCRL